MSNTPPNQPKPKRISPALIGAGVLVIALGFGLPLLTPTTAPEPAPREPGAKQAPPTSIQPPATTGIGASLLKLAIGLVVVCGLCVLVARWMGPKPPATPGAMEVVASIAVGHCVVHLVRAGERRLLIGTDLGGVKSLIELPGPSPELPPEAPTATTEPSAAAPTPTATAPPTHEEILKLLLQLRTRTDASPPA